MNLVFLGLGAFLHDPLKPGIFFEATYVSASVCGVFPHFFFYDLVVLLNMTKLFVQHGEVGYITELSLL